MEKKKHSALYPVVNEKTRLLPIYLDGIGINPRQEERKRPQGHTKHHLFIVLEGSGQLICEGQSLCVQKGSCFFIEQGTPHWYYETQPPFQTAWLTFEGGMCEKMFLYANVRKFCFKDSVPELLIEQHRQLYKKQLNQIDEREISALLYAYVSDFLNYLGQTNPKNQNALSAVTDYIRKNYQRDITLEELAEVCGMSKYAFCRSFKAAYYETPFEYLLRTRISAAKKMLVEEKDLRIQQIGELAGFHDTGYFIRTFRRFEKMTPGKFRKL